MKLKVSCLRQKILGEFFETADETTRHVGHQISLPQSERRVELFQRVTTLAVAWIGTLNIVGRARMVIRNEAPLLDRS